MATHVATIGFDFDAMSGFISRGLTSPTPISRGEFGPVAVPRILALLKKYSIRASWFVPGHTLETYPTECRMIFDAGHEIGHHGWTHMPPNDMTREQEEDGLVRANEQIKKLTGRYARGYRSPSWDLSPHSVELLLKHGFFYESSMMGNDHMPYRVRQGDIIELDVKARKLQLHVSDAELAKRRKAWKGFQTPHKRGYAKMYVDTVLQADKGVDLDFLVGKSGTPTLRESH